MDGGSGFLLGSEGGARWVQTIDEATESRRVVSLGSGVSGATGGTVCLNGLHCGTMVGLVVGFGLGLGRGLQFELKLAFTNKLV